MNYAIYEFIFGYLKIVYEKDVLIGLYKIDKTKDTGQKTLFTDIVYKQVC